jgi:muramoyltetrapeptide carboxypeptidase
MRSNPGTNEMDSKIQIGIVAPSSQVPKIELKLGIEHIKRSGFKVKVHPQCKKSFLFFAGTDQERANAILEFAQDQQTSVIWCARGGHGCLRLLPLLTNSKSGTHPKKPYQKKLLIGYSDITALMTYVRERWGWATLHAPMPSFRKFSLLEGLDWKTLIGWIRGRQGIAPWENCTLKFLCFPPSSPIQAPLIGGNLTVWNALTGTPFQPDAKDCILFFEDVDESIYRLDRVLRQLLLAGSFRGVKAILLGNFMNCRDYSPSVLKTQPKSESKSARHLLTSPQQKDLKPLRKILTENWAIQEIFKQIGLHLQIPVAIGLPVGHGPEVSPLPLGARYHLDPSGKLSLISWSWLK